MKRIALALIALLAAANAAASPIVYTQLDNAIAALGEISPSGHSAQNDGAQYFSFHTDGGVVTLDGSRIDGGFDMAFWLFSGLFADTDAFGSSFDDSDAGFIAFRDDNSAPAVPGPFGDPFFSAPLAAGWYTVAVTNFASNGITGTDGLYDFSVTATGVTAVPEPLSLALTGLALAAMATVRRRA